MKNWIRTQVNRFRFVWHAEMARTYIMWYNKGAMSLTEANKLILPHIVKLIEAADRLTGLGYYLSQETTEAIERYRLLYNTYN